MSQELYFQQLNRDLKKQGTGLPQLIIDRQCLQQNIQYIQLQFSQAVHLQPRLVVKSLACLELLQLLSEQLSTQRFMVFHLPQLIPLLENFSEADVLFGKPMPVRAVQHFYQHYSQWGNAQIQWLVDTPARLHQYLEVAQQYAVQLQINIEIDVGLHRGGIRTEQQMAEMMDIVQAHPQHLKFSGLMGYDAHVTKLPSIIKKAQVAYEESQQIYAGFIDYLQRTYPALWHDQLCLNGGGSPSFSFHVKHSVCNDLSFGSMLVKPGDFDNEFLKPLQTAMWIATPVIKELPLTRLPGMPLLEKIPQRSKALFIYGGYWMADYVYPQGSHPHMLYGRSSNQELVNVPRHARTGVDDYVFLRPTQSEAVIPQFATLWLYKDRQFEAWQTFRE